VTEAAALAVAAAGICVGALSSGAVGLGFPIVVIPALALGYGLETAVVVSALPAFAIDLANLIDTRAERPPERDGTRPDPRRCDRGLHRHRARAATTDEGHARPFR
jgi:hypothetical protein